MQRLNDSQLQCSNGDLMIYYQALLLEGFWPLGMQRASKHQVFHFQSAKKITLFLFRRPFKWGMGTSGETNPLSIYWGLFALRTLCKSIMAATYFLKSEEFFLLQSVLLHHSTKSIPQVSGQYVPAKRHFGAIFDPQVECLLRSIWKTSIFHLEWII